MTAGSGRRGDLVVLAGGRSTRFGEADKTLADLAGKPLVRHGADRCAAVTSRTVVNCRPDQRERLAAAFGDHPGPVCFALDDVTDAGPVAGMLAGLRATASEYALVLACDVPFVTRELATLLFDRAAGRDGAVPRADGRLQPTCAVYRVDPTLAACRHTLERGDGKATALAEALSLRVVDEATARAHGGHRAFENVNTRSALDRAERRLTQRSD